MLIISSNLSEIPWTEKKKCEWKYTHCVNLLIAKVIKLNGEYFIFTAKPNAHTILTCAFQVLTLVAYNILFCIKKTFRKKCHFDWYRVKCTRGCDTSQMIFMKNIFWKKNHLIWNKVAIFWLIRLTVVVVYRNVYSPNKFSRRHYRLDYFFRFSILPDCSVPRNLDLNSKLEKSRSKSRGQDSGRFGSIRVGWSRLGLVRVSLGRLGSVRVSSVRLGGFGRVRISSDWYMVSAPSLRTRLRTLICWMVLHTGKPHEFCK